MNYEIDMKKTERIFDIDSKTSVFDATVLSCEQKEDGLYAVVLDKTAFFPNEGGQSSDGGNIDGIEVISVDEKNGMIIHTLGGAIESGKSVRGEIDFAGRYRKMQDHTAEHIVSGIIYSLFGYNNVGFHLGDDYMTADFDGELTEDDILLVETKANEAVYACRPIRAYYPDAEELARMEYRSKLDFYENVRIVEIEGVDRCACCAPHVESTGEIGLIKIVEAIRYKGGMRLTMLAGSDALDDYRHRLEQIKHISIAISSKQSEVAIGVDRMLCEIGELKGKISAMKRELMSYKLERIGYTDESILLFESEGDMLDMRNFVNEAVKKTGKLCACFSGEDGSGYKYIIASENIPLRELSVKIRESLGGKGGGSDVMIQGSVTASRDQIQDFFKF